MTPVVIERPVLSVAGYYADPHVRARILESCGALPTQLPTAAYVVALDANSGDRPTWDAARRIPMAQVDSVWGLDADLARSLWDASHLLFVLELDYENVDMPAEPFLHPADVFLKLEPAYRAAKQVFARLNLPLLAVATGRGYHFAGQIRLDHPLIDALAEIVPETPAWHAGVDSRRPPGVTLAMSDRHARAAAGLGCVVEYVAHQVREHASMSEIPLVFNGTVVGRTGPVGRECISIDFSYVGDPLDLRHLRVPFSTYQANRFRPDIFGAAAAGVAPVAAIPRRRESLTHLLMNGRTLDAARRRARRVPAVLPDIAAGLETVVLAYRMSALGDFHRRFHAELRSTSVPPPLDLPRLPPCVSAALVHPNDLLLRPEHIQHVVRALLSHEWTPAAIARVIQVAYQSDDAWGDRWTARMHAGTRAEFEVRVFAGMVTVHADALIDFNCVSAQEKGVCPRVGCPHDLRVDRDRLAARTI